MECRQYEDPGGFLYQVGLCLCLTERGIAIQKKNEGQRAFSWPFSRGILPWSKGSSEGEAGAGIAPADNKKKWGRSK